MKKPVPRKLKLPPATIVEPPRRVGSAPSRTVPPRPKLPSSAAQQTPIVFTPIEPPRPRADAYRPPAPQPVLGPEPLAAPVPPPPLPREDLPPPERRAPRARRKEQESGSRSGPRDFMIAAIGALIMFLVAIIPAAMGIDAFGIGRMLGIASRQTTVQPATPAPQPPAPQGASVRDIEILNLRLNQATERIVSLERSVEVLAARSSGAEVHDAPQTDLSTAQQPPADNIPGFGTTVVEQASPQPAQEAPAETAAAPKPTVSESTTEQGGLKSDRVTYTLKPGQGIKVNLAMDKGATVRYAWTVRGGLVNYDMQGNGEETTTTYKSRRDASSDNGVLTAAVTGNHGWLWRNAGNQDVVVTLATRGAYSRLTSSP
ncbi:MAG: hypothetical protein LCH46_04045 [Proteobacteria bacterium]|nr:hypothetical protein [Pseudomonadota bacterium]